MSQQDRLSELRSNFALFNSFIINSFKQDESGNYIFSVDYQSFTVQSAFINFYICWEHFLEQSFLGYLVGDLTLSGNIIHTYVQPPNLEHANKILIGTQRYVDWSNPEIIVKLADLYFINGDPFHTVMNSIKTSLFDLKTIRNSCAHISTTTSTQLASLASRLLNVNTTNIQVSNLILSIDPNGNGTDTILDMYMQILDASAVNISQ